MRRGNWEYVAQLPDSHQLLRNGFGRLNDEIVMFGGRTKLSEPNNSVLTYSPAGNKMTCYNAALRKNVVHPFQQEISVKNEIVSVGGDE